MYKLTRILTTCSFLLASSYLSANCSKDDIDYYLEKGFSHNQVTELCSSKNEVKKNNSYTSFTDEYIDQQDADYKKRMRIERQVFLKGSIAAKNIRIRGNMLTYLEEVCGRNSLKNNAGKTEGATAEGCAVVRVSINLAKIEVMQDAKRERGLFGAKQIHIKGDIKKEIIGGLENLDEFNKELLKPHLMRKISAKANEARIPIKKGLDFYYALESFTDIVNFEKQRSSEVRFENNMGGALSDEDLNMTKGDDFLIEEEKGFEIRFSNDESIDDDIIFEDIESSNSDEIPDEVFN